MEKREILRTLEGRNIDGSIKSVMQIDFYFAQEGSENLDVKKISSDKDGFISDAYFHFEEHNEFSQVDIHFSEKNSESLKRTWEQLEQYGRIMHESNMEEDGKEIIMRNSFVPLIESVEWIIICLNPVFWSIIPNFITGEPDTIRILYKSDNFIYTPVDIDKKAEKIY